MPTTTNTVTMLESLINPQVMADMVSAELENKLRATQFIKVDRTLTGRAGNTITVPTWQYIGEAADLPENTQGDVLLDDICRYCNNYFNPKNDPTAGRTYPTSFLELANRIAFFNALVADRDNAVTSTIPGGSVTVDLERSSWQKMFARDLAMWKRARFL